MPDGGETSFKTSFEIPKAQSEAVRTEQHASH